jgi:phospholipid/cholesterol/gamma-HCH transport system substrate-binding protein
MSSFRQVAIGIFIAGGLLLFAAGLFWIGDRRQLFNESIELNTEFSNVSGLARGALVRVAGLDAGEVLEIRVPPDPGSRFRIRFRVVSRFRPILREDSIASIQNDGLVGNKFLQVDAGTSAAAAVGDGGMIPNREPIEISDLMAQASDTVKAANLAVEDIRTGIDQTVKAVLDLNKQTVEVINSVGSQVNTFTEAGNRITGDVSAMVAGVRQGQGTIGKLLTDDKLYDDFRGVASQGQTAINNVKASSEDLKSITDDFKSRELGAKVESFTQSVDSLAKEAIGVVQKFRGSDGTSGGLMTEIRQTLNGANEAMADFAENAEALKRNWFFRGFFNNRGFFDLDAVTVREYGEGRFLTDRQKVSAWLDAADLFAAMPDGTEQITPEGRKKLDMGMAGFLRYSKNDPFIIESWAGEGSDPASVLRARTRAILVSEYLVRQFDLKPNYVAIMPMNAALPAGSQARDGIGLTLFVSKTSSR